jgi:hypothetical protein
MADTPRPKAAIRRFDVFAEYAKLEALRDGRPLDAAKGHGVWLAKVVASRRRGPAVSLSRPGAGAGRAERAGGVPDEEEKFKTLGGEVQDDARFDREIVERMGERFYEEVFAPTLRRHFERGDRYETIRDTVRRDWRP